MRRLILLALSFVAAATLACGGDRPATDTPTDRTNDTTTVRTASAPAGVVDSALPIDTLLHRFRAAIADTPTTLTGGESSPERLARALLTALQANDTSTLRALVLSRAEFAWLYFPHTKWMRPPYEMGPDLIWLQIGANSEKGAVRLLRRYGGSRLRFEALGCPDSTAIEGPNRVVAGCRVRFSAGDSTSRELRLFGSLLNRGGRYKFVSYANEL